MIITHNNHTHEVSVEDDGTLDTVIIVDDVEFRYSDADRDADGCIRYQWLLAVTIDACGSFDATV